MPLNPRVLGDALDEDLTLHTTLCRRDAPAFQKAMTQVLKTYRVQPSTTPMEPLLPKYN